MRRIDDELIPDNEIKLQSTPEGIVHDSTTGSCNGYRVFEMYLACNRYFRKLVKDRFNMDLKFDIELSIKL